MFWEPEFREGLLLAPVPVVLRHLGTDPSILQIPSERLSAQDRIEFAVEHALRDGLVSAAELLVSGGNHLGDAMLRSVVAKRGGQPPTESYAETQAVQLLRCLGWDCWRQVTIVGGGGRIVHRVDLVIPFDRKRCRPEVLRPADGLLVEIDSEQFHASNFEQDHKRQSTYDVLGYHWITVTPRQIAHQPHLVERAINGALRRRGVQTSRKGGARSRRGPHSGGI
jgi:hypothetical protein